MRLFNRPFLFSSLLLIGCFKASPVSAWIDTLRAFPEDRFINGTQEFGRQLMRNLRYPSQAQQKAIVGTSLISVTIAPSGKLVNVAILNSLGKAIDGEVRKVIQSTEKLWLPSGQQSNQDSIMMILPVTFLLGDKNFYVEEVKPEYILSKNETVVVGYGSSTSVKDDEYYTTQLVAAIEEKNYELGLTQINELIRRNPYSEKLYFQRANLEKQLGQTDEACRDYKNIINLLGKRHLPKLFIQNCS